MPSQIFKAPIPKHVLYDFLKSICVSQDDNFHINNACFKRAVITNTLDIFLNKILNYYHKSKQTYVTRKQTYVTLVTIIRQICKVNKIPYTTHLMYDKSKYEIRYVIQHVDDSANSSTID